MKKIVAGLFKVILLVCVFFLLLSFSVNGMIKDGISSVVNSNLDVIPELNEIGIDGEKIAELMEDEEVQELVMEYVEPVLGGEVDIENVNIGEDIFEFVNENKSKIEEVVGQPIDMEKVEEFTRSEEMNKINDQYKDVVIQTSGEVPVEVKNMVYTYGFFFTTQFRSLMTGIIVLAIVVIMIIEKSFHSWMSSVGKTLTGCGILLGVFVFAGSTILTKVLETFEFGTISFDYKNGLICAVISVVLGIILMIVYSMIEKRIKERSVLNEISEVSK